MGRGVRFISKYTLGRKYMKKLMYLINFEFTHSIKKVLMLCAVMALIQNLSFIVFGWRKEYEALRFEHLLDISKYSLIFYMFFILLIGLQLYIFEKDYSGGKGIYTLMTLPSKRINIYISKYVSSLLAFITLIVVQTINIFITYGLYRICYSNAVRMNRGLYMAFMRDRFLGMFFIRSLPEAVLLIAVIISAAVISVFAAINISAKRYYSLLLAAFLLIPLNGLYRFVSDIRDYYNYGHRYNYGSFIFVVIVIILTNALMSYLSIRCIEKNYLQ
jgi:hypothetical protein